MVELDWKEIKHFSPNENWGDKALLKKELVVALDAWRDYINCPVVVTCATQGKHAKGSEHYEGMAADVIVLYNAATPTLFDAFMSAVRFPFRSLGFYLDWELNGVKYGGLHLGIRESLYRKLWMHTRAEGYIAFNADNLRKYSVPI